MGCCPPGRHLVGASGAPMSTSDLLEPLASDQEAEMAKVALRCLIAALDHSRAERIALIDEKGELADAPIL